MKCIVTSPSQQPIQQLIQCIIKLEAYYEMYEANELGFRLNAIPIILPDGGENPYPIPSMFSSDSFNVNAVNFFSDGGLSGKTSALKRHYKNSNEQGILRLKKEQYLNLLQSSHDKGFGRCHTRHR